jgi:hypothetical protein
MGDGLENLVNLRKLGVSQNQITTLDGLEPLQALDELDARDNCIERVREVEFLERLPLFSSLLLQGNPCSDLPFYRRRVVFRLQQLRTLDGIAVTSDDKIKAINLHGGDESDLKHRRETFRKHFGGALEFEDPLPPVHKSNRGGASPPTAESRPPRHRRDAGSMAWRRGSFTARFGQHGAPDSLVDLRTGYHPSSNRNGARSTSTCASYRDWRCI